ncbi:repeat domain (List_Bact_rpt) [Fibrobacter sp. UWB11]|nr:repeat domain (List_Bact_rpt) [Fibrobacter sp. UWB11]
MTSYLLHPFRSLRLGLVLIFTLLMAATSWGYIFYIDENGEREPVSLFNYLSKDIDHMTLMQNNGIYVVYDTVDLGDKNIGFEGSIKIILMDGAYLNCNKLYYKKDLGLSDVPSISIFVGSTSYYKPILGTGVLNVKNGIDPTTASNVSIAIYGGHVTTDYNNPKNDSHKDNVRIDVQNFEFHGGNVDVEELDATSITLGWKNPTDSFRVRNVIHANTFTIKNDLYVKDENGKFYSGQLSVDNIYSILDKTLVPAKTPFFYMDENGVERSVEDYVILDTLLPNIKESTKLPGGWYVVSDRVTFEGQIDFGDEDVNLIIADNAEFNVVEYEKDILFGIKSQGNLNIYGQKNGSGKLNVYSQKGSYEYVQGDIGAGRNKDLIINGISVKVGGQLFASKGRVIFNGGSYNVGRVESGSITLDWRKKTDSIKVGMFIVAGGHQPGSFVQIAEGKAFGDEDGKAYTGKVYSTETVYDALWEKDEYLSSLNGKTLKPCYAVTFQALNGTEPVVAAATFNEQGYANIAEPPAPTRNGSKFYRWSTTEDGTRGYFFNIPVTENMTLFAQWNKDRLEYIDENGQSQSLNSYTVLTSDLIKANEEEGVVNLPGAWYVVHNTFYDSVDVYVEDYTLSFNGDAHIILADGAELKAIAYDKTVIQSSGNLTFYAQTLGTGKLTAYDSSETNSTILAHQKVTFNGGIVTVRNGHAAGRPAVKTEYYPGRIYINSGIVNISSNTDAEEPEYTLKVYDVILDWRSAKDRYTLGSANSFSIANGKTFKEENGKICHRYEYNNAFKDKPIVPCYIVYIDNQDGIQPKETIASFDENGEAHVTKPEDPTRVGTTFVGWAATKEGTKVFDWSAPISGHTTAYAIWDDMKPVEYVDEDGKTQKVTEYFLLTSDIGEPDENHYLRFTGGWYVVQGEVTFSSEALKTLSFSDDVHLILADGAKLNVEAQNMYFDALYIHTQSRGTGSFNAKKLGISENLCIYGGNFTFDEIVADGDGATINGGNINVGRIYAYGLVVNGGSVDASLMEGWSVTLGWNSTDDHITAEELRIAASSPSMAIDIAKGKAFKDEDGNIYDEPVPINFYGSSLSGKMLTPLKWITSEDIVVDDIAVQAYTGNPVCPDVVVKDGKKTLKVKTDYTVECFENVEKSSTAPYVKITGMGNYRGDIEKHFAILERTADFASVGIFKDEDGHSIAAIDANYGEDGTVNIDEEITVDSVKFERSFTKESRSTIVLPFSVSTSQIKGLKQVLAFSKIVVEDGQKAVGMHVVWENTSSEHVTLNAYTPYIVLMDGDKFDIKGSVTLEVTRDAVDNGTNKSSEWEFRGSLTYKKWEEGNPELGSIYGFAGNADKKTGVEVGDFVKAAAGAWVNPMRAYLVKKSSASAVRANGAIAKTATTSSIDELPASMRIVIIDDEETEEEHTTVIGQHNVRTTPYRVNFMPHTYDLKGRIVGNGKKARGAYYGKKFVK